MIDGWRKCVCVGFGGVWCWVCGCWVWVGGDAARRWIRNGAAARREARGFDCGCVEVWD